MLVLLGCAWALAGFGADTGSIVRVLATLLILLGGGGVALGYGAAWIGLLTDGMVPTPRKLWLVEPRDDAVRITAGSRTVLIPLTEVQDVTLVMDDSWDQMRGMETRCLVLRLLRAGRLSIPGSSHGFDELLGALRRAMAVNVKSL